MPEETDAENTDVREDKEGPGLTPDGNLTLVDDIGPVTSEGKQFITLVTKNGNYFYLIIDRDDKGRENVYFLNLVDERDILALMEEEEASEYQEQKAPKETEKSSTEEMPKTEEPGSDPEDPGSKPRDIRAMLPVVGILLIVSGGVFIFMKFKNKKNENTPDPDADYAEEDEEDYAAGTDEPEVQKSEEKAEPEETIPKIEEREVMAE